MSSVSTFGAHSNIVYLLIPQKSQIFKPFKFYSRDNIFKKNKKKLIENSYKKDPVSLANTLEFFFTDVISVADLGSIQ